MQQRWRNIFEYYQTAGLKLRHDITPSYSVQRCLTCFGFIPSFLVALRQASFLAVVQSAAVAVPKANRGKPGFRLSGMVSSASALQLQVHPRTGLAGLMTDLSAPLIAIFKGVGKISSSAHAFQGDCRRYRFVLDAGAGARRGGICANKPGDLRYKVKPPSMMWIAPVVKADSSEAR
jgi:hypothetical protein